MQFSTLGIDLLTELEGLELKAYTDTAGILTIGIGHALTPKELETGVLDRLNIPWKDGISKETAYALCHLDVMDAQNAINASVKVPLKQNQFDALVCFCFNVGRGGFRGSTLLKRLNSSSYKDVPNEMMRWIHSNGKPSEGLMNRRKKEVSLWRKG